MIENTQRNLAVLVVHVAVDLHGPCDACRAEDAARRSAAGHWAGNAPWYALPSVTGSA